MVHNLKQNGKVTRMPHITKYRSFVSQDFFFYQIIVRNAKYIKKSKTNLEKTFITIFGSYTCRPKKMKKSGTIVVRKSKLFIKNTINRFKNRLT